MVSIFNPSMGEAEPEMLDMGMAWFLFCYDLESWFYLAVIWEVESCVCVHRKN